MSQDREFWFRPKSHGFGASPIGWKGWAATLGYAAVEVLITYAVLIAPMGARGAPTMMQVAVWLALVALTTAGFAWLAVHKTEGDWRWRWGKRP